MRHYFNKGWAYKVDYDKEMVEDQKQIDLLQSKAVERREALLDVLDLNGSHLAAIGDYCYMGRPEDAWYAAMSEGFYGPSVARDANRICERLRGLPLMTEDERKKELKKAKASLARHRRNKALYGK